MPNNRLKEFVDRLKSLESKMETHLIESGGIQAHLKVNTWLTGVILVALVTKFIGEWFKQ